LIIIIFQVFLLFLNPSFWINYRRNGKTYASLPSRAGGLPSLINENNKADYKLVLSNNIEIFIFDQKTTYIAYR